MTVRPYKQLVVFVAQVVDDDGTVLDELSLSNRGEPFITFDAGDIGELETKMIEQAESQRAAETNGKIGAET